MKSNAPTSRRDFLRNALALTVVSTATPNVVLGNLIPDIRKSGALYIATYSIKVSDYHPNLDYVGDSVKLSKLDQLQLNQDNQEHFNPAEWSRTYFDGTIIEKEGWFPIAVTRVAESGVDAFKAVSTYCLHGTGTQVNYKPHDKPRQVGRFVCPHQKSTYEADGTWVPKDNTPDLEDKENDPGNARGTVHLRKFPTSFDDVDTIIISGVAVEISDVPESYIPQTVFLDQNYPNPFNPSTIIRYGLPDDMRVRMTVHTLLGKQIKELFDEKQEAGIHFYDFSAADLPSGVYFYRLETPAGTLTRRMTVSK